ncbi:MAG: hypothetical protein ABDH28_05300 [Brevinematia bacterium]
MGRVALAILVVSLIFVLGCPRERYVGTTSGGINIPLATYSGILVAKLSAFDEVKKLYYSTFRPVPLRYPSKKVFTIKDIRELRNIYVELKQYVPPAVREDNLMIKVGEEIVGYDFLRDRSAVLLTFEPGEYDVSLLSSSAIEKNDKAYVTIEYSISPCNEKKYPYLLILFDNPVKKDIEVSVIEKK